MAHGLPAGPESAERIRQGGLPEGPRDAVGRARRRRGRCGEDRGPGRDLCARRRSRRTAHRARAGRADAQEHDELGSSLRQHGGQDQCQTGSHHVRAALLPGGGQADGGHGPGNRIPHTCAWATSGRGGLVGIPAPDLHDHRSGEHAGGLPTVLRRRQGGRHPVPGCHRHARGDHPGPLHRTGDRGSAHEQEARGTSRR
ncbi:hypothetical protein HMPREF1043_0020 [Streptococcus anginosus subsp. whileyi CCUG 39159]|uniref:Uncharacterized protein n=1 Tax=Streptococcus anginosus subsp. whileyi CCUG 39159 TaxID=1095729 RepID=I0S9D0_STRAP|nr:hypothetical protein HMPREF1043_0020 [Streptococcus anginosus subsp. whileyi CCUG 39159]